MENYEFANSAKPSETFIHPIECKRSLNPVSELYVRTGSIPANADQRLYDLGNFQIATGGNSGSGILGELWVTFEICLFKPKLVSSIGMELLTDHWISATGIANTKPLGTAQTLQTGSNLGTTITGANSNVVNFPSNISDGDYVIVYQVTGNTTAITSPAITSTNSSFPAIFIADSTANINNSGTTTNIAIIVFVIKVTSANATFTIGVAGTLPASATSMDLFISQYNGDIIT